MNKLENKQKVVGAGIIVAGMALLWYLFTRESKSKSKEEEEVVKQKESKEDKVSEQKNEGPVESRQDQMQELEKFV